MSSTNRNPKKRYIDYYYTPIEQIELFLREFNNINPGALTGNILDPCAGGDERRPMSYPTALQNHGIDQRKITTVDIRQNSPAQITADYTKYNFNKKFDAIITNPPFSIALEIIEKSLEDVKEGGIVAMLLRLNFFGSKNRKPFWEQNMPKYCFVHHRRMKFTEDGGGDSVEYMHAVWQKGYSTRNTSLFII